MNHTKQEELAQLQARYPTFSPFVLLKLSMIRYGAVLTPAALEKIQGSIYAFSSDNAFDIRFPAARPVLPCPDRFCCGTAPSFTSTTATLMRTPIRLTGRAGCFC